MFTNPPFKVAISQFSGYNIQLPRVLEMKPDYNDGLYCWCYTIYAAHKEKKTIQEVLDMTPELQAYAEQDKVYFRFCQRYNLVSADPETRQKYHKWTLLQMKEWGIRQTAIEDGREEGMRRGIEEGIEKGIEKGREEAFQSIIEAIELLRLGRPVGEIVEITQLFYEKVESLRQKV